MPTPTTRSVHPYEHKDLNSRFYRANPAEYLQLRLEGLLLVVDSSGDAGELLVRGVSFGDFKLSIDEDDVLDDKRKLTYATLESVVLLHHATETLLRLYLAHAHRNPCPWLEVASLMDFREFKRRVSKLKGDLENRQQFDDVLEVFTYANSREAEFFQGSVSAEQWEGHRLGLKALLDYVIGIYLDDSRIYNTAKHGLSILSSSLGFQFGTEGDFLIEQDGPTLTLLEKLETEDKDLAWNISTAWAHPTKALALTAMVNRQIESLWNSAKIHYGCDPKDAPVLVEIETIEHLLSIGVKAGFNTNRMSERLR